MSRVDECDQLFVPSRVEFKPTRSHRKRPKATNQLDTSHFSSNTPHPPIPHHPKRSSHISLFWVFWMMIADWLLEWGVLYEVCESASLCDCWQRGLASFWCIPNTVPWTIRVGSALWVATHTQWCLHRLFWRSQSGGPSPRSILPLRCVGIVGERYPINWCRCSWPDWVAWWVSHTPPIQYRATIVCTCTWNLYLTCLVATWEYRLFKYSNSKSNSDFIINFMLYLLVRLVFAGTLWPVSIDLSIANRYEYADYTFTLIPDSTIPISGEV